MKPINYEKLMRIARIVVFVTLIASLAFSAYRVLSSPADAKDIIDGNVIRTKSDYVLMCLQCLLGIFVLFLPSFIEKHFNFSIPNGMYIMYIIFLYCAIYLGEVRSFYYRIPNWDTYLHAMSSMMLGTLGFSVVSFLNSHDTVAVKMNPIFVALFAFSFAVMIGTLWEVYEYTFDGLLGLNMQKFASDGGVNLIGRAALSDTMDDIIVYVIGALISAVIGYFTLIYHPRKSRS